MQGSIIGLFTFFCFLWVNFETCIGGTECLFSKSLVITLRFISCKKQNQNFNVTVKMIPERALFKDDKYIECNCLTWSHTSSNIPYSWSLQSSIPKWYKIMLKGSRIYHIRSVNTEQGCSHMEFLIVVTVKNWFNRPAFYYLRWLPRVIANIILPECELENET